MIKYLETQAGKGHNEEDKSESFIKAIQHMKKVTGKSSFNLGEVGELIGK